jgi:hypothetical protein
VIDGACRISQIVRPFVRAVEVWVPSADRTHLDLRDGLYGPLRDLRAASETTRVGSGEDLAGRAWSTHHPIVVKKFDCLGGGRADAATAAGLTCGIALPVFVGELLTGVMVLFCGDAEPHVGAIEVWYNDPEKFNEMRLFGGYYGTADMFELDSRYTRFPRGYGLPGRVWKMNMPAIVSDLSSFKSFLRWKEAVDIGLSLGFGIPYPPVSGQSWAMTFLSGRKTPIARRVEIWIPDAQNECLNFSSGYCDQVADLAMNYQSVRIRKDEGIIGRAWSSGAPVARERVVDDSMSSKMAAAVGLTSAVVLPVMGADAAKAIVAWFN